MLPVKLAKFASAVTTSEILHKLGFPVHRCGYDHLIVAITRYAEGDMQSFTKELYPYVAEFFGYTDWPAVEHSIRTVIADTWEIRDPRLWELYFPRCCKAPSNKQFIATLAEAVKQNTPPEDGRG